MLLRSEEKMENTGKMVICPNCGAEFDVSLVRCPYCDAGYAPAEEEEDMGQLEEIRKEMPEYGAVLDKIDLSVANAVKE
jgi:hypothetical protein